jgi:hypothetical protein
VTFARPEPHRFGRALLFKHARSPQRDVISLLRAPAVGIRPPETGATVLFIALFSLFFAPVIRLFCARAFSIAISMAFPVFGAYRRPVNRLYFSSTGFHRRADALASR